MLCCELQYDFLNAQHYLAYYAKNIQKINNNNMFTFRFVSFTHRTTLHIINLYKAYLIAHFYYSCNKLSIKFVIPVTVFVKFLIRCPSKKTFMVFWVFGQCHGHSLFVVVVLLIVIEQHYINYRNKQKRRRNKQKNNHFLSFPLSIKCALQKNIECN